MKTRRITFVDYYYYDWLGLTSVLSEVTHQEQIMLEKLLMSPAARMNNCDNTCSYSNKNI